MQTGEAIEAIPHAAEIGRATFDWLSIGIIVATLASMLPPIAATLAIVYHLIRIWELPTVQRWRRCLRVWWRR
jgi:chromate transport protein ChrA